MGFALCPRCLQRCNTKAKLAIKQNDKSEFEGNTANVGLGSPFGGAVKKRFIGIGF